ncbi:MAG: M23 family metallopeptidase [Anaerolineaceae bacterium]|nr:M23 family metallopeptidase [Anaerolineaceae bacterium]
MRKTIFMVLIIILSACRPVGVTSTVLPATATAAPTQTAQPTPSPSPTTLPPASTPTEEPFAICCPLEDEAIDSLPLIVVNTLVEPYAWGTDFGHPGVDFAYYQRGDRESIEGIEIYAIMAGQAALILDDLYPYGYTIVIETPLAELPEDLQQSLMAAYEPVPENLDYQYNCPNVPTPTLTGEYSLYHLYAHQQVRPAFEVGEEIACGQLLGTVGNSGWSSNPHLHLETRLGPSGLEITTMAHYETTATEEQLSNYCLWRSSGYYQIVDPFEILNTIP